MAFEAETSHAYGRSGLMKLKLLAMLAGLGVSSFASGCVVRPYGSYYGYAAPAYGGYYYPYSSYYYSRPYSGYGYRSGWGRGYYYRPHGYGWGGGYRGGRRW